MNLDDLTETARCKQCRTPEGHLVHVGSLYEGGLTGDWWDRCLRCHDHPGIDPDVIRKHIIMGAWADHQSDEIHDAVVVIL